MQLSHVISDAVLSAAGWYAFVVHFSRLGIRLASLWGVFLIPVALAALFGALRFAGVHENMVHISSFFQQVATTLGACGLMLGSYGLISREPLQLWSVVFCLLAGLALMGMVVFLDVSSVSGLTPLLAMLSATVCGVVALAIGNKRVGVFLVIAVLLSAAALWTLQNLSNDRLKIDAYHYLLAASLISFAMAARARQASSTRDPTS